jgi:hypothetical protein
VQDSGLLSDKGHIVAQQSDPSPNQRKSAFESLGDGKQLSIVQEFVLFIRETGKWWLIPIVVVFALVGLLVVLGSTGAAPFIYTLF